MAEGAQVEAGNSSINKKPATECVWDIRYFQNQFYATNLACIEFSHTIFFKSTHTLLIVT